MLMVYKKLIIYIYILFFIILERLFIMYLFIFLNIDQPSSSNAPVSPFSSNVIFLI